MQHQSKELNENVQYMNENLAIIVIGASGDLAKKKTFPSIFRLYVEGLLPTSAPSQNDLGRDRCSTIIWGYSRSALTHETLREKIRPYLIRTLEDGSGRADNSLSPKNDLTKTGTFLNSNMALVEKFLSMCFYQRGRNYGDIDAYRNMHREVQQFNKESLHYSKNNNGNENSLNHLFYLAIPPNVFGDAASSIKQVFEIESGKYNQTIKSNKSLSLSSSAAPSPWLRIIVEKPFGNDLKSYRILSNDLLPNNEIGGEKGFSENQLYRIDHYLGKEMVQTILPFRQFNSWLKPLWNRHYISHVTISLKETIGTEGRGGYFDRYGIVRDVVQNHLLQVLSLIAMEEVDKEKNNRNNNSDSEGEWIRDAKSSVLDHIQPPKLMNDENGTCSCVLGQYEGYTDDPTIQNKESRTATFVALKLFVYNDRWRGVPFILVAGKALEERVAEVRITFRSSNSSTSLPKQTMHGSQLVFRIQPDSTIYITANVKSKGYSNDIVKRKLILSDGHDPSLQDDNAATDTTISNKNDLNSNAHQSHHYHSDEVTPAKHQKEQDAYSRLILDALQGKGASFVRDDELMKSWEIFTPLLEEIEDISTGGIIPFPYKKGSTGPKEATAMIFPDEEQHDLQSGSWIKSNL